MRDSVRCGHGVAVVCVTFSIRFQEVFNFFFFFYFLSYGEKFWCGPTLLKCDSLVVGGDSISKGRHEGRIPVGHECRFLAGMSR